MMHCWFGLVVLIPGIPLWKGSLLKGISLESQTTGPFNQQLTSWKTIEPWGSTCWLELSSDMGRLGLHWTTWWAYHDTTCWKSSGGDRFFFSPGVFPKMLGGNDLITLVIVYIYIYNSICLEILQIPLFFADSERLFILVPLYIIVPRFFMF